MNGGPALVERVVAIGLPACAHDPIDEPDDATFDALVASAGAQRLEGALIAAIEAGGLPVSQHQRRAAVAAHRRAMALALTLERELVQLHDVLGDLRVPYRVLKGSAAAHLDEADPTHRAFGDIDILVRGDDLAAVQRAVEALGGSRRYPEPRRGFDARFSKGMSFRFDRNCEIDVHRTLASGAFGLALDVDELFANVQPFALGGRTMLALDRPSRFLHACYHAMLGGRDVRLASLRDVVHTAPIDAGSTRTILDRARRWRADAVVAAAVGHLQRHLGWRPPPLLAAWTASYRMNARDERWLQAYVGAPRSYAAQMLVGLETVDGARDKLAYALANTLPAGARGRPADRLERGVKALAQAVGR